MVCSEKSFLWTRCCRSSIWIDVRRSEIEQLYCKSEIEKEQEKITTHNMNIKYSRRLVTPQGAVLDDSDGDIYIQPSTRVPFIYDASRPIEFKIRASGDGKLLGNSEFDRVVHNFSSNARVVSTNSVNRVKPSSPATPSTPIKEEVVDSGESKPCQPRPKCLDATPPCSPPVPAGGWCKDEPVSGKKEIVSTDLIAYGIGILVGGGSGYYIAAKKNRSIIGGIVLGGAIGAGLAWTFLHRTYLLERVNAISKTKPADTVGNNFSGRYKNPQATKKICKNMECCKKNPDATTSGGFDCWIFLR